MHRPFQTTPVVPRLLALAALGALSLSACSAGSGAETGDRHATEGPAAASSGTSNRSGGQTPSAAPSSQQSAEQPATGSPSTGSPAAGEAADGEGPVVPGAANEAWMEQARKAVADTDPRSTACLDTLLDQTMLDAVATYLPQVDAVVLGGQRHEAGCTFSAAGNPGTTPTVQVKRFYLANDTSKTMDETGLLGSDMCAADREQDANGISTEVGDAVVSTGPEGDVRATVRGAWSCSEDGGTGSGFLVSAGAAEQDRIPDPDQLAAPGLAVAAATHLHDTEVDWAPTLDDLYETNFRDILGQ